ncbi:DUF748 domain-containing protein [bacterium]|nr:DUF748 domain-containing protein [bacterium]
MPESRRVRRWTIGIVAALVIYTGFGFFGVPAILRHVLTGSVAKSLKRQVGVGEIAFNPYSLRLEIDKLAVARRSGGGAFVEIGHLGVEASWNSLWRLAPVVEEVAITNPTINIVRTAPNTFNFSDLIPPPKPASAASPPSKPFHFSVSNIQISGGAINFDDQVLGQRHTVQNLRIDVPFIANLPAYVKVYVKPYVAMVVDGSKLAMAGTARPFGAEPESELVLNLRSLEISKYLAYVPRKLPITMPHGALSTYLLIHFVQATQGPQIRIGGRVRLDQLDVRDQSGQPLVGFNRLLVVLNNVEPLHNYVHLAAIKLDGLKASLTLNADGTTNFSRLASSSEAPPQSTPPAAGVGFTPAPAAPSGATSSPAPPPGAAMRAPAVAVGASPVTSNPSLVQAAPAAPSGAPAPPAQAGAPAAPGKAALDLQVVSIDVTNGAVNLQDNQMPAPVNTAMQSIAAHVSDFHLGAGAPIPYSFGATLSGGGAIAAKGALDLAGSAATTQLTLSQIDVPALQGFAQSILAGKIAAGKVNASANVKADYAPGKFNLHVEPAQASLDGFEIQLPERGQQPIRWTSIGAQLAMADLQAHQATVDRLSTDGISVEVVRDRRGRLNLESLLKSTQSESHVARRGRPHPRRARAPRRPERRRAARKPAMPTAKAPQWQFQIKTVAFDKTAITLRDETERPELRATIAPLNIDLKDVTSNFAKPFGVAIGATVNRRGTLKITGDAAVKPLKANLRVVTRRLDLTPANAVLAARMNAVVARAMLSSSGAVRVAQERRAMRISYRGDVTLGDVRMLDKLTRDLFARWRALRFERIDFAMGEGKPRIHLGAIAFDDFYARVILNRDGKLNLSDIMANPQAAPTSLTRAHGTVAAPAPSPPPAPAPQAAGAGQQAPAAPPKPLPADIRIGEIVLAGGEANYTDNFIRPNYSADLTDLTGKIGEFGTDSTKPADVSLNGMVNRNAPISISGAVSPLAPMAYLDITAKANGIELPDLSAYSAKYTGYPITQGTLTVDVHYLLDQRNLTAQNHIRIDQLTFGDKVPQPSVYNLPVRLAVAILKDSQGRIDLNIPVSGSLNNPQFSLGSVIWYAFKNLIMKAITSPFKLLASALPGGGSAEGLSYVGFKPGFARLNADDRKKLDEVAAALKQRSALKLNITGVVDPSLDQPGLCEAKVDYLVRKRKAEDSGQENVNLDDLQITTGEYDKYLKQVYKAADIPDKPRDFLGMAKSLPPAEMEKLLVANMKVSAADLPGLGRARAEAVRTYLKTRIDPERLIVSPAKIAASQPGGSEPPTRACALRSE